MECQFKPHTEGKVVCVSCGRILSTPFWQTPEKVHAPCKPNRANKKTPEPKSRGLGDTVHKVTVATGIKPAVDKVSSFLGIKDCGCEKRQGLLNRLFPYRH